MNELLISLTPDQSLQAALDALPAGADTPVRIRLSEGAWREKITLTRPNTTLEGAGADRTTLPWDDAATAPRERAGQAIALYADGDGFLCEDCRLSGAQDTLFTAPLPPREAQPGGFIGPKRFAPRVPQRQVYRRCRIEGDVDFIFGSAAAWFEDCDIVSIDGRADRSAPFGGYATAASTPEGQRYGYVFNRCRFLSEGCPDGSVYLGRPWRAFARTVLLRCELGAHIRPEGWHDWNQPTFPETGLYAEYACYGPGAAGEPVPSARRLSDAEAEAYTLEEFLATAP